MKRLLFSLLICCAGLVGCATPSIESSPFPAQETACAVVRAGDVLDFRFLHRPTSQTQPYRIGIGDTLRVDVFDHEKLNQAKVLVLPDGYISLPLVPRLEVGGHTLEDVGKQIADRYRQQKIRDPQVSVSVESGSGRLRTFLDSVHQAGGSQGVLVTVESDGAIAAPAIDPIKANRALGEIRRRVEEAYAALFGPDLAVVVRLVSGEDRLAYVLGEVTRPGPVKIGVDMNAMKAVARAGGFLRSADLEKVRVYRNSPVGGVSQWELNLADSLNKGRHVDAMLPVCAEDVVFVPKTGIAEANDAMDQYIRRMLPLSVGFGFGYNLNPSGNQ